MPAAETAGRDSTDFNQPQKLRINNEYPPAMHLLGRTRVALKFINHEGAISNQTIGIAGRSNKEFRIMKFFPFDIHPLVA